MNFCLDCSNGNGTASGVNDERIVKQYHFLMWKDFVAPEHPNAVLKFIKVKYCIFPIYFTFVKIFPYTYL